MTKRFEPTAAERLIIAMLCDIYEKLEIKNSFDVELLREAAVGPHHWALQWKYHGFDEDPVDENLASEVADILDMWDFIELSYEELSKEDQEALERYHTFDGFDYNDSEEVQCAGVADLLINRLNRWKNFAGRDLNSHIPSLDRHRRMLSRFTPMKKAWARSGASKFCLTGEQLTELFAS